MIMKCIIIHTGHFKCDHLMINCRLKRRARALAILMIESLQDLEEVSGKPRDKTVG